ncbi:DUF4097 family beta strand repeat protein [Micromonospora echinofusca]|uniref:DUF4097 family beta strand repeat protein n=1 Tax=Micromonospora echinofusca TaxID=47858 RepID=A0ABS3W131_MICEH|nr:DUF4097 family beta strand repeat protein [Micromonospora echinofusca]
MTGATAALLLGALVGCGELAQRRLDFSDTEAVKITKITILPGSGDVLVRTAAVPDTSIKRVVRYQGGQQPKAAYRLEGTELVLDTDCGRRCSVSFEVLAPEGVTVSGENGSGDVELTRVGAVDLVVGSGDIRVRGTSAGVRAETGSGSIEVTDVTGAVRLRAGSGGVTGRGLRGAEIDAETGSGDIELTLEAPGPVRAHAGSGSVEVTVPPGAYQVRARTGSGQTTVGVPDDPTARLVLDVGADSGDVTVQPR